MSTPEKSLVSEINVAMGYSEINWASEETPMEFLYRLRRGQVRLTTGDATLVDEDSSGEEPFFVFRLNDQLYRIDGSSSSWGDHVYDSAPYPVVSETVTKLVYSRQ